MNIYSFMGSHPFLTFFLAYLMAKLLLKSWVLFWRHWSIRIHGYPPVHCDADGDFKDEDD